MLASARAARDRDTTTKRYAVVFVFVLIGFSSIWDIRFEYIRSAYNVIALPIRIPLQTVRKVTSDIDGAFTDRAALRKENAQLRAQLEKMNQTLDGLTEVRLQNERLSKLLEFKQADRTTDFTVAEVIGRDPNPMRRTLLLDKGAAAGIVRDSPVVVPAGVIGRVIEVYRYASRVLLLQDKQSSIGAMIQKTRAMGDAMGQGSQNLALRNLPPDMPVQVGDLVITSGMSTFYPKGLPIGMVVERRDSPQKLSLEVLVRPSADTNRCEEVLVLKRPSPSSQ